MIRHLCVLAAVLPLVCSVANAQEFRATISGHVLDSSGAAAPGVKVQAINVDNNETATAVTDNSGSYSLPFLRPGKYKLTAEAPGFKQYVRENIVLEVGKITGIDISLEVGSLSESVQVTAEAAFLETQTASRGGVVNTQQVAELPLNARNPFMLGSIMSGVTFNGAAIWQRPFDNGAIAEWSVNGSRNSSAEFMLDGASNDAQMGSNNIAYVPVVDAVQEFNVMTNQYSAEYGHSGGGIMNVVLKSGTNQFHGSGWEFLRRTPLDANTFQNNAQGKPRPEHYLDQYGGMVSGPVYVPRLLKRDGNVRLFYLGTFENYREGTPNPLNVSYPEPEMRQGDFSKLTSGGANPTPVIIYNPFSSTLDASGAPVREPFPGNRIPASMINPVAAAVTKFMPVPNQPAVAGNRYSTTNLGLPGYFDTDKFYNLVLKFDWNFGDKHRAFFRHASNDRTENRAVNGIDNKPGTDGQQPFQRINDAYVLDWVSNVSPTLILNARGSFSRFIEKGFGAANAGFDLSTFGLPASLINSLPGGAFFGRFNFYTGNSGTTKLYESLGRGQSNNFTNTYQLVASLTKISGKHTIKAGVDMRQINYLIQNTGDVLRFDSYATPTGKSYNQSDPNSGDPYASFLLGIPQGDSNFPVFPWWRNWYIAPYVNDDWKISRKLTLNLGLRLDLNSPVTERWNRMNGAFDPNASTSVAGPNGPISLRGGFTFAGVNGIGTAPANYRKNNWQPRFGAAYQISDRLVMRGGAGIYYSNFNNDMFRTNGFSTDTQLVNSTDDQRTFIPNILTNPYPNGIQQPTGSSLGALTFVGKDSNWFDSNYKLPKVWMYSFGFQFQVTQTSTLDASYVGSHSYDLTNEINYNIPSTGFRQQCNPMEGGSGAYCDASVPNPFKGVEAFRGTTFYTADTISRFQASRPFPQFNGNLLHQGINDSELSYNSLQLNYTVRMSSLVLIGNYTLSKQIETWGYNDPYRSVAQRSLYTLDRPQVIKMTAVYDLPFGQGKRWGNGAGGFMKRLISGWGINTIFTDPLSGFPSDLPGNVIQLKDPSTAAGWSGKTDWKAHQVRLWSPCVLDQKADGSVVPFTYSVNAGCGTDPANYVWMRAYDGQGAGTDYMGQAYQPRYTPRRSGQIRRQHAFYLDASLLKDTRITERVHAQFGLEAFNLLNHNYFGRDQVQQDPASPNFGTVIPSTVSTQNILPRQLQIRMKVMW